jgi:ABC-2 type transport system ATP-binding protein
VTASAPALRATGLSKRFGARTALDGVSCEVAPGEVLAVLGPNGAGKTTLLSILAGVQAPDAGEVDRTVREVGWVPQHPAVYARLSVAENLQLFARLERLPDPRAAVDRMLAQTGLADRARDELGSLSGGNRQRVNIAVGLLADPPVLALDEPSGSLDPHQRERLWEFLDAQATRGTAVVFTTHDLAEADRHADRLLVLDEGRVAFAGPGDALAPDGDGRHSEAGLERAYLRLLGAGAERD